MSMLERILPEDEPEGDFIRFYGKLGALALPVAALVSYSRNKDLKWAVIHGMLGVPYLAYVVVSTISQDEAEALYDVFEVFHANRSQ